MKLTSFTDYGLRALMRLASEPDRLWSASELADEFEISYNHLTKVMQQLARAGFIETQRGSGGGATLARPARDIRIGDVVRVLETGQAMVECFRTDGGACNITPQCRLKGILSKGEKAFLHALDGHSLAECALLPRETAEGVS